MDQNTGSFMSSSAGGVNGMGPALQALIQRGGTPNSTTPQAAQSAQTAGMPQTQAIPQGMQQQPAATPYTPSNGAADLQVALKALAQYVNSHGAVHEAQHDVAIKKAQATAMTPKTQAQ